MSQKRPRRSAKKTSAANRASPGGVSGGAKSGAQSKTVSEPETQPSELPSASTRTWVSILVSLHLVALGVSFTSVVEPSGLHASVSQIFYPYLRVTHFGADDRPVYLTHAESADQPHRLQVTTDGLSDLAAIDSCDWRTVGMGSVDASQAAPGLATSDRVHRWLSTASTLAENEQPGVVADLLLPIAASIADARAIRIIRIPTDLNDVNSTEQSPYVARVVRDQDRVSLVQLSPERLSSVVVDEMGGSEDE